MTQQTTSAIDIQMNEFNVNLNFIDHSIDGLCSLTEEIINDNKIANNTLNEAKTHANESNLKVNSSELDKFSNDMADLLQKQFEKIKNTTKSLAMLKNDCIEFQGLEHEVRQQFLANIDDFDEANVNRLVNFRATRNGFDVNNDQKYTKLIELIDKYNGNSEADDLVIDTPVENQVIRCPITGKEIKEAFKNKCGHSYEKEAIFNYLKQGRQHTRKCPYAGCQGTVSLNDIKMASK